MSTKVEETEVLDEVNETEKKWGIVVWNDDHNSFEHVINTFIEILNHTSQQAEQCAMLIHLMKRARVKTGSFEELKPMKEGLTDRGLSAELVEL